MLPPPACARPQEAEVQEAKRRGDYESGIVRPTCGDIKLSQQEVGAPPAYARGAGVHSYIHLRVRHAHN